MISERDSITVVTVIVCFSNQTDNDRNVDNDDDDDE